MKKILSLLLCASLLLVAAAGCGGTGNTAPAETTENPAQTPTQTPTQTPSEEPDVQGQDQESVETQKEDAAVHVTFCYNYEDAPEDVVIELAQESAIQPYDGETENTAPETPVRDGYRLQVGIPARIPCWRMAARQHCGPLGTTTSATTLRWGRQWESRKRRWTSPAM